MGSSAGGEQSAMQPPVRLQLSNSPVPPSGIVPPASFDPELDRDPEPEPDRDPALEPDRDPALEPDAALALALDADPDPPLVALPLDPVDPWPPSATLLRPPSADLAGSEEPHPERPHAAAASITT
jgi:hypothetical protein